MNVCRASPHCPTIIDGTVGTTMNTASSAGPMRRGRSVQRRPRNRLAANQVTIEAATTNAGDGEVAADAPVGEVEGVEPEQQVGDDEQGQRRAPR